MEVISKNIDSDIQSKESELSLLTQRMEEQKIEFIKETVVFAADWYRKTVKEYVSKYPEITLNMSEEKIARMKTRISALIQSNEKTIDELSNTSLWWHQKPNITDSVEQYTQIADKYPVALDRAVRRALGRLGLILEEFKFRVNASGTVGIFQEFWYEPGKDAKTPSVPSFPHLLDWSSGMQTAIRKYNVHYVQGFKLFREIQVLKDQKKREQAMSRWDAF